LIEIANQKTFQKNGNISNEENTNIASKSLAAIISSKSKQDIRKSVPDSIAFILADTSC